MLVVIVISLRLQDVLSLPIAVFLVALVVLAEIALSAEQ
jgi:hypothetical protein